MAQPDPRLVQLRGLFSAHADAVHADFHQAYHKSQLRFIGLRTPQLNAIWREVWPSRQQLTRAEVLPLLAPLWDSHCFEEGATAIYLLGRVARLLTPADLPLLHAQTRRCAGWGPLDFLALRVLGPVASNCGSGIYRPVLAWLDDEWLWTRRAAILIHVVPARQGKLEPAFAWPSFAARLAEKEFFIRKAIGWALRECCKRYAPDVVRFVQQHRERMAGLTLREATRNLPAEVRAVALRA
jgi:hypothetical protein